MSLLGGDLLTDEDLVTGAEAARILGIPRSQVAKYDERKSLPLARLEMEGKRRKPLYRREDVLRIKEYREARAALKAQAATTEGT